MDAQQHTTIDRLRQVLAGKFEIAPEAVQPDARMDQLAIDSLALIEIMFELEDEFDISFPREPGELATVGDLVACIDQLAAEGRAKAGAAPP